MDQDEKVIFRRHPHRPAPYLGPGDFGPGAVGEGPRGTEHIGSLTQFGEFTAARADHKAMEPSVDRLRQYVELIRRFAKVSWRAR